MKSVKENSFSKRKKNKLSIHLIRIFTLLGIALSIVGFYGDSLFKQGYSAVCFFLSSLLFLNVSWNLFKLIRLEEKERNEKNRGIHQN